jgi:hypothetical protein
MTEIFQSDIGFQGLALLTALPHTGELHRVIYYYCYHYY